MPTCEMGLLQQQYRLSFVKQSVDIYKSTIKHKLKHVDNGKPANI